jgi:hypothetical protein
VPAGESEGVGEREGAVKSFSRRTAGAPFWYGKGAWVAGASLPSGRVAHGLCRVKGLRDHRIAGAPLAHLAHNTGSDARACVFSACVYVCVCVCACVCVCVCVCAPIVSHSPFLIYRSAGRRFCRRWRTSSARCARRWAHKRFKPQCNGVWTTPQTSRREGANQGLPTTATPNRCVVRPEFPRSATFLSPNLPLRHLGTRPAKSSQPQMVLSICAD